MATTKTQRWGILTILIVTVVGTVGGFAVMILSAQNQAEVQAAYQKASAAYNTESEAYQKLVDAQSDELSAKYYKSFSKYTSRVGTFDLDSVDTLVKKDLVVGTGDKITGTTAFAAYYIGWNPKGKIFDQSIDTSTNKLKAPLYDTVQLDQGLDNATLIDGWKEGLVGMKIGGVRELTIPSDQAYGETGQGDDIPANTPLKFIVMAIAVPETIEQPASLQEAKNTYYKAMSDYYGY